MKKLFLSVLLLIVLNVCFAQKGQTIYKQANRFINNKNLSLIDTDTLERWNYILDTAYKGLPGDSIKAIGRIIFLRNKALYDKESHNVYGNDWKPSIYFAIYTTADSGFCIQRSQMVIRYSNCVAPNVGGDMFYAGKYIFLNPSVCINCTKYDNGVDFCRPVINYVFSKINPTKASSINEIVKQFPISRFQAK